MYGKSKYFRLNLNKHTTNKWNFALFRERKKSFEFQEE